MSNVKGKVFFKTYLACLENHFRARGKDFLIIKFSDHGKNEALVSSHFHSSFYKLFYVRLGKC